MTKPYPTVSEVEKASGDPELLWDRIEPEALIKIICDLDRKREAPAEDRIDWAAYPWAKWAAKDADGSIALFEIEPIIDIAHTIDGQWVCKIGFTSKWTSMKNATIPGPWQESLRARPEGI